ncbi:MAG: hypothetical protein K6F37_07630 [Lachnospiraceae bacterium]|nr:hypothetical protein [Lachnospiraceae bacterium]
MIPEDKSIMIRLSSEGNGITIKSEFKASRDEVALVLGQKMFEIELLTRTFVTSEAYPGILEKIMPYYDTDMSKYDDYKMVTFDKNGIDVAVKDVIE